MQKLTDYVVGKFAVVADSNYDLYEVLKVDGLIDDTGDDGKPFTLVALLCMDDASVEVTPLRTFINTWLLFANEADARKYIEARKARHAVENGGD